MPRKKPGPGHPVTTGMAKTTPVHYRLTQQDRYRLEWAAGFSGTTPNLYSKMATLEAIGALERAFPAVNPKRRGKR